MSSPDLGETILERLALANKLDFKLSWDNLSNEFLTINTSPLAQFEKCILRSLRSL